jgi:hypothetical protein
MLFSEIKLFREYSETTTYSKDLVNYQPTIQPQTGALIAETQKATTHNGLHRRWP